MNLDEYGFADFMYLEKSFAGSGFGSLFGNASYDKDLDPNNTLYRRIKMELSISLNFSFSLTSHHCVLLFDMNKSSFCFTQNTTDMGKCDEEL